MLLESSFAKIYYVCSNVKMVTVSIGIAQGIKLVKYVMIQFIKKQKQHLSKSCYHVKAIKGTWQ